MLSVSMLLTRLYMDDVISGIDEVMEDVEDGEGKSKVDSIGGVGAV